MKYAGFAKIHTPIHVMIVKLNLKENIKKATHILIIFTEILLKYHKEGNRQKY